MKIDVDELLTAIDEQREAYNELIPHENSFSEKVLTILEKVVKKAKINHLEYIKETGPR